MAASSQSNTIMRASNVTSLTQSNVMTYSNAIPKVSATAGPQHVQSTERLQPPSSTTYAQATIQSQPSSSNMNVSNLNPIAEQCHPAYPPISNTGVQQQLLDMQHQHHDSLLSTHQQLASVMSLPLPEVPKFKGDHMEYNTFVLAFDARISSRATTDADRLYYLQQHMEGLPRELISGCLHMQSDEGYIYGSTESSPKKGIWQPPQNIYVLCQQHS